MAHRRPRLLIVDDEAPLVASLRRAAQADGYAVDAATSGAEALALLAEDRYDLVVTDLRMPGIDGPELMAKLQEDAVPTRVMVITGYATLDAAVDCLRKGAVDFLVKPFQVEAFLTGVARALRRPLPTGADAPDWNALAIRFDLTPRQREILAAFYATGKTNRQLAAELSVSPHTIKSHLKAACIKLGVSTRTELLQRLREAT